MDYIKAIRDLDKTDLPIAGGKGANLGALLRAGLPVPPGFCITTAAYRAFVAENGLEVVILSALENLSAEDPGALEAASARIRAAFAAGKIAEDVAGAILAGYRELRPGTEDGRRSTVIGPSSSVGAAVAVRSSATAEDLPDLSFAGQQDTYLNILGAESLLEAVVRCWASLWTARAIGYRARNQISHDEVALAVVVQQMVQSEAAGVLFTANPLTGKRSETVIDATLGLGEALVSGQVEPDHYVVAPLPEGEGTGVRVIKKTLGAKALSIQGQAEGGTVTLHHSAADRQALPDEQILALARLGQQAQTYFGNPQDMEWAWANGSLYVVQSRPVTSLFPLPTGLKDEPLEVLLSFGVWQGMLDPYTPIGQDMFGMLISGMGQLFGLKTSAREQRVFLSAGERLFVNLTGLISNPIGRKVANIFVGAMDPISGAILAGLLEDPRLAAEKPFSLGARLRLVRVLAPLIGNVFFDLLWPARGRARLEKQIDAALAEAQRRCNAAQNLTELIEAIEAVAAKMPQKMLPRLVGGIAAGQIPYQSLLQRASELPGGQELAMELTRGQPHNVTTQMDLALWRTAQAIRADANAAAHFSATEVERLVAEYRAEKLPTIAQTAIRGFLSAYGMRGVGEVDLGRPRWCENPSDLFQVLKSYLQIDPATSPEAVFQRGAEKARQAQAQLEQVFSQAPKGKRISPRMVRMMVERSRELGGLRETPKFFIVRQLGFYRKALLAAGQKLVEIGRLVEADDVLFLHLWELKALSSDEARNWKALIAERRTTYARELRRRRIPRIMLSDGTAFYDAPSTGDAANTLSGSPVSAGTVEGTVRVVFDPHGVQLVPGEILVCPATDPAWTPLFLAAGGLVTEVGGMMTHGSVVAREYGIPAVVGVSQATTRLQTGQRVRVDGSMGKISILEWRN